MRKKNILSRPVVTAMAVAVMLWCGCGWPYIKLIDQPAVALPNDSISVRISIGTFGTEELALSDFNQERLSVLKMAPFSEKIVSYYAKLFSGGLNLYFIFSVCIPDGFETDNPIPYRLDQNLQVIEGSLHYVKWISEAMNASWPPASGYHWRSYAGNRPFMWEDRDISMTVGMKLPDTAMDCFIDYAFGHAEAVSFDTLSFQNLSLSPRYSTQHFLTTGEPEQYLVSSAAASGPGTLSAALDSIVNFGIITFDFTQLPSVLQLPSLNTSKPFWIKGDGDQLLTLLVDGSLTTSTGLPAPVIFSDIRIECSMTPSQPVISNYVFPAPLIFENVRFANNTRPSDLIRSEDGNLSFINCSFENNQTSTQVYATRQVTRITNCSFHGNEGDASTMLEYSDIDIDNTVFRDSISPMQAVYSSVIMKNISFAGRDAFDIYWSNLDLYNSVLWSASEFQMATVPGVNGRSNVSHCNIKDSAILFVNWLEGNISEDPLFLASGDHWCQLQFGSPSIDAGTHMVPGWPVHHLDCAGNSRILDGDGDGVAVIDMGAYEAKSTGVRTPEMHVGGSGLQVSVFPNPFADRITIQYTLETPQKPEIEFYNHLGQRVGYLNEGMKPSGNHQTGISLSNLPAGVYFCRVRAGNKNRTIKLIKQ